MGVWWQVMGCMSIGMSIHAHGGYAWAWEHICSGIWLYGCMGWVHAGCYMHGFNGWGGHWYKLVKYNEPRYFLLSLKFTSWTMKLFHINFIFYFFYGHTLRSHYYGQIYENVIFKAFEPLIRCKLNMDQEEWPCTRKWMCWYFNTF